MRFALLLSFGIALGASACGARTGLGSLQPDDAGEVDAAKPRDAGIDAPVYRDATPVPDATGPDEAGTLFCTPGVYYVEVTDDAGTRKLTSPCPNGGFAVPTAGVGICSGEDAPIGCVFVAACGDGRRMTMTSSQVYWLPPGSSSTSVLRFDDAGAHVGPGKFTIGNWPGPGGTVAGEYDAGPISGRFCVRQQ